MAKKNRAVVIHEVLNYDESLAAIARLAGAYTPRVNNGNFFARYPDEWNDAYKADVDDGRAVLQKIRDLIDTTLGEVG